MIRHARRRADHEAVYDERGVIKANMHQRHIRGDLNEKHPEGIETAQNNALATCTRRQTLNRRLQGLRTYLPIPYGYTVCAEPVTQAPAYNCSILALYFLFLPLPPPPEPFPLPPVGSIAPCVAPPPPLRLLPCPNVDRSVFLSHRSGSGGGVTPGTTPFGTRFMRTFFSFAGAPADADASAETEAACCCVCWGGGAVCREPETAEGRASSARRNPDVWKSRCFWAASRFVRMSECSSELCTQRNVSTVRWMRDITSNERDKGVWDL